MKDDFRYDNINQIPRLIISDNEIIDANNSLCELTGYSKDELLSNSTEEIFIKFKINSTLQDILNINVTKSFYIFTKQSQAREIYINIIKEKSSNIQICLFIETEYPRVEQRFMYLHNMAERNHKGIAIFSMPDLVLLMASQKYIDNFIDVEQSRFELIGTKMSDIAPKWDLGKKFWDNRLKSKEDMFMNEAYINGKYMDAHFLPIIENGITKYYVITVTECTERVIYRKRLESQARVINDQKEELEAIIENMSDIFTVIDKHGNYIKMNAEARKLDPEILVGLLGKYSRNEIFYSEKGERLASEDLPANMLIEGKNVVNSRIVLKTNESEAVFEVKGTPVLDCQGRFRYGILNSHDISEYIRHLKIIEDHKKELEFIIENINEAIYIYKNKKEYLRNKLAREWFRGNGLGPCLFDMYNLYDANGNPVTEEKLLISDILNGLNLENKKYILENRDDKDKRKIIRVNGTSLMDKEENFDVSIISIRDVTEEERKEEMYRQHTERLLNLEIEKAHTLENVISMKEEFLATISHEFKTPLTVINAIIQTLETFYSNEMSGKVMDYLKKIRQNSFRQLRLVNNLVDITRVNTDKFKIHKRNLDIVFLTSIITESVQTFAQQKGVGLYFSSEIAKLVIGIDEEIYERILLNLLSNAIKFTPQGKSIYVDVEKKRHNVAIYVRDEGIGIPKDKQKLIFERFGQVDNSLSRQAEGSGIGLSLVSSLVTALGGRITLKSCMNKGSIFKVTLPNVLVNDIAEETGASSEIDKRLIQTTKIEFSHVYID